MDYRLGFTGDVMLGRLVDEYQRTRPVSAVWGDMLQVLEQLDGLIINLECVIATEGQPWQRTDRPFHFMADPDWAIPALHEAGVDCCALANNHVLDFEVSALLEMLSTLEAADIEYAGAGRTLDRALTPAVFSVDELTVAVVSFTDNTPEYAADVDAPGTAHVLFDIENERTRDRVTTALDRAHNHDPDLLVASLHWGPNMVTEPPEAFQTFARWLVDHGVDVIHGHSAHVFQGVEVYDGSVILYDTGDFVDDYAVDSDLRNDRSFLFELEIDAPGSLRTLRLRPTEIRECSVHQARPEVVRWCLERMKDLSEPFGTTFEQEGDCLRLEW